jgi:hypothetical protein
MTRPPEAWTNRSDAFFGHQQLPHVPARPTSVIDFGDFEPLGEAQPGDVDGKHGDTLYKFSMCGGVLAGELVEWEFEVEGSCRHVPVIKNTADEREGGVTRGEDDFIRELKAKVVGDENKEVRKVAKRSSDLCEGAGCITVR